MTTYDTGWVLFALMLALTLFNARKKLPFLPVLSATAWLQFHIWAGLLSAAVFFWHIGWDWPTGWFNWIFIALYALVMVSGIVGWVWSRTIPKQLTARGGEVIWEEIQARRAGVREEAEALALKSATVGQFFTEHLHEFFLGERADVLPKIENLKKFLSDEERGVADRLMALAREKNDLDYHYTRQLRLKGWLFVHIPLTYSLLLFMVVHIVIVYAFSGGAR